MHVDAAYGGALILSDRHRHQLPPEIEPVAWANQINSQIRLCLLQRGEAVIAQTQIANCIYLKFTLLNPRTTLTPIQTLLNSIQQLGKELEEIG